MKTLFAEPKTASQAAYVCRVVERAERLTEEGYRIQQMGLTKLYAIFKPGNDSRRNADRNYLVDMTPHKERCTCEGFKAGDCKHHLAVVLETERVEAQIAQMEADHEARYYMHTL